ncbi:hypothetical protein BB560_001799 [Smittium megazygosporum]|uniref:non-specific serine/threonine protein kinase n=1 Tax=Smittium megazygosporum TaxID=133381 RepID=A0A2T9ZGS6_9FUNG|nr:hypothetical protein BB560_001799 [Smittium megazygosporum]
MSENKPAPVISIGDYIIGNEIGRGSFAKVYKGFNNKTQENVAIKSVSRIKLTKKLLDNLEIEINILKSSHHENVVELIECLKSKNRIHLVMSYCSLGDLSKYIKSRKQVPLLQNSFGGSALEYLRQKNVIHRDIKPQNLLLCPPNDNYVPGESEANFIFPILKIADFGFARSLMQSSLADTLCGSPLYMAPEILRYEKYDARADLWSVGAVVYEMCTGKPPFRASNHIELQHKIEKYNDIVPFPEESKSLKSSYSDHSIPVSLKELISSLLKKRPDDRISFGLFFEKAASGSRSYLETSKQRYFDSLKNTKTSLDFKSSDNLTANKNIPRPSQGTNSKKQNFSPNYPPVDSTQPNLPSKPLDESLSDKKALSESPSSEKLKASISSNQSLEKFTSSDHLNIYKNNKPAKKTTATTKPSIPTGTKSTQPDDNLYLENEYVVIEKRAVEINALADEMDTSSNKSQPSYTDPRSRGIRPFVLDQISALSLAVSNAVPTDSQKTSSSIYKVPEDAGNPSQKTQSSQGGVNKKNVYHSESFSFLDANLYNKFSIKSDIPSEEPIIRQMESLAYKAHSVSWLADMKVSYLQTFEENGKFKGAENEENEDKMELLMLLMGTDINISNGEAFALYLKALSLLHKAIICAKEYWNTKEGLSAEMTKVSASGTTNRITNPQNHPNSLARKVSGHTTSNHSSTKSGEPFSLTHRSEKAASQAFNNAVQWVRNKFNTCLENADLLKSISSKNEIDFTNVSIERILYEKALELSKAAAQRELKWELPFECERAYQLAIWMLSAILEPTSGDPEISIEDRQIVENFVSAVVKRLESLRERISKSILDSQ